MNPPPDEGNTVGSLFNENRSAKCSLPPSHYCNIVYNVNTNPHIVNDVNTTGHHNVLHNYIVLRRLLTHLKIQGLLSTNPLTNQRLVTTLQAM